MIIANLDLIITATTTLGLVFGVLAATPWVLMLLDKKM